MSGTSRLNEAFRAFDDFTEAACSYLWTEKTFRSSARGIPLELWEGVPEVFPYARKLIEVLGQGSGHHLDWLPESCPVGVRVVLESAASFSRGLILNRWGWDVHGLDVATVNALASERKAKLRELEAAMEAAEEAHRKAEDEARHDGGCPGNFAARDIYVEKRVEPQSRELIRLRNEYKYLYHKALIGCCPAILTRHQADELMHLQAELELIFPSQPKPKDVSESGKPPTKTKPKDAVEESKPPENVDELPDLVTLDQAADCKPEKEEQPAPKLDPLDENSLADVLVTKGYTLEAAFVRHFKDRQITTWQEIVQAVCPGEERDWGTVKTWATRVKNALADVAPHCRLTFRTSQRRFLVIKKALPE
jgi:hypothetical protein